VGLVLDLFWMGVGVSENMVNLLVVLFAYDRSPLMMLLWFVWPMGEIL